MIEINNISKDNWYSILATNSADDIETIEYLKSHEEEILNLLITDGVEKSLSEKRKIYIRNILSDSSYKDDLEEVISKILEIRENEGYSVLQFGKRLPGSSYVVFEFGDKVLKFGKYYRVLKNKNILQPEFQLNFDTNQYMTVYERVIEVFTADDKDIALEMYFRVRDDGILWFDAIGYNIGRTNKRIDENDDGLRVIDAQYMEYEFELYDRIKPESNEKYKTSGPGSYHAALIDYIKEKGYFSFEKRYQERKEQQREQMNRVSQEEVKVVKKRPSIFGLQKLKELFSINNIDEKKTRKGR